MAAGNLLLIIAEFRVLLGLIVGVNGMLASAVLYFLNKSESFSARMLAVYLFCLSFVLIATVLSLTDFFLDYPHFWRLPVIPSLCVPPLAYLYVRTVLEQQYRFRKSDLVFFVPALLYFLNMLPFYLKPTAEKLEILRGLFANERQIALEPEGMIPPGWGMAFRLSYGLVFTVAQFVLVARTRKRMMLSEEKHLAQNRQIFQWLFFFTLVISFTYLFLLADYLLHLSRYINFFVVISFILTGTVLFYCAYLIWKPNILYGFTGWGKGTPDISAVSPVTEAPIPSVKARRDSLRIEQREEFSALIARHFKDTHAFTKPGYTIQDLSTELNLPSYQLSAFINQEYGINFNEWINNHRIDYLRELFHSSPEYANYTMEALGQLAGFKSKSSFVAAVKKKTGQTPSAFFSVQQNGG
jgi:AraC-like DNA-binding protein